MSRTIRQRKIGRNKRSRVQELRRNSRWGHNPTPQSRGMDTRSIAPAILSDILVSDKAIAQYVKLIEPTTRGAAIFAIKVTVIRGDRSDRNKDLFRAAGVRPFRHANIHRPVVLFVRDGVGCLVTRAIEDDRKFVVLSTYPTRKDP